MSHHSWRTAVTAPIFGGPIYILFTLLALIPFVPLFLLGWAEATAANLFGKKSRLFLGLGWILADKLERAERYILSRAVPEHTNFEDVSALRLIPGSLLMCVVVLPLFIIAFLCAGALVLGGWLCAGASVLGKWLCEKWEALENWTYN